MRSLAAWACLLAATAVSPAVAQQACPTLTVTTNDDVVNGDTSSPCNLIANPGADGISLREALLAANNATGSVTITFAGALAGRTIALTERFAPITSSQIALTGLTSNGQPNITLDATNASNPGAILFVAASNFTMNGISLTNIPAGFTGVQIGGSGYGLRGQTVSAPQQLSNIAISGNAFSNGTGNNVFAVSISTTAGITTGATIGGVVIANNTFTNLFEAIGIGAEGTSNTIENIAIFGNAFSQMTSPATSAVEVGASSMNNTVQGVQLVQNTFVGNLQGFVIDINGTSSGNLIQDVTVDSNVFSGNLQALGVVAGVDAGSNSNTVMNTQIVNNLIDLTGYQGQGSVTIQITDSQNGGTNDRVAGVTLINNTIYADPASSDPPGWGVWVTSNTGGVSGVSISNDIISGSTQSSSPFQDVSPGQVVNSLIYGSNSGGITNGTNGDIVGADPMFVNAAGGNFGLRSNSLAIGGGTGTGAPAIDIDCQLRNSPPSIGAYELDGPNVCSGSAETLIVDPAGNMSASGVQGGPFTPASFQYQLVSSGGDIGYSISGVPTWLTASSTSGTITISTAVTFTVNPNANSLAPGTYGPTTITFTNTTNGQGNTSLTATLVVNPMPPPVSLSVSETGSGSVTSNDGAISCPATCSANYANGTQVTLTATPSGGYGFSGWGGACSGTGSCMVTMTAAESVSATFTQVTYALSVGVSGSGAVTSTPSGINCGSTCAASFASGTAVTLNETPASGWVFSVWSGACSGTGSCMVTMNSAASVSATFARATLTRTFVSSAGVDSNPCSIAAPCATFAVAYTAVQPNGIIAALDPGKYGPLTITYPVTINGNGWAAITGTAQGNGITINAGSGNVILTGLEIDGAGAAYNGIVFNSGTSLTVSNCIVKDFISSNGTSGNGIMIAPTSGTVDFTIVNTVALNNGSAGVHYLPASGSATAIGAIDHLIAANNTIGIAVDLSAASGGSAAVTISNSVANNNTGDGIVTASAAGTVTVTADRDEISSNGTGVGVGANTTVLLSRSVIAKNSTYGVSNFGTAETLNDNRIYANGISNAVQGNALTPVSPQ